MQLLYKTVNLSIAENKTIRRLQDISYSAISQQRQEAQKNQAERVQVKWIEKNHKMQLQEKRYKNYNAQYV